MFLADFRQRKFRR